MLQSPVVVAILRCLYFIVITLSRFVQVIYKTLTLEVLYFVTCALSVTVCVLAESIPIPQVLYFLNCQCVFRRFGILHAKEAADIGLALVSLL